MGFTGIFLQGKSRPTLFISGVDVSDFSGIHSHIAAFATGNYSVLNSKLLFM